jgi:protein-tyrosine phosphatase
MRLRFPAAALLVLALPPAAQAQPAHVSPASPLAAPAPHQRLLPLEGGRNFRDLGGYRAQDGRHVKWGLLFRSGAMHGLTAADYAYLEKRGIRVVCDFRDSRERAAQPVNWPSGAAPRLLFDDYRLDMAGMMPKGPPSGWTEADARAAFTASYPRMLGQFNGQYRRMFAELLAGHAPLAFNCSAGKDRTGIAAALILTALGVPRATVIEDYALSDRYSEPLFALLCRNPRYGLNSDTPRETWLPMTRAYPEYIETMLDTLAARHGSVEAYLDEQLGVDRRAIERLRDNLLE